MTDASTDRVRRAEKRVVSAALQLVKAGKGFVFNDVGAVSHKGMAIKLEYACQALKDARKK